MQCLVSSYVSVLKCNRFYCIIYYFQKVLSEMCYELCEHMLDVINQNWIVWMASRSFVNQYRSASTTSTRNMEKMIPYMQRQYGIPQTYWKETTNKIK